VARFATGLAVLIAVGLVSVGSAQGAIYKGGIKGDPDASLKMTVKKIEGDRFVTRIEFKKIPLRCDEGRTEASGDATTGKPDSFGLQIKANEFSGPWEYGKVSGEATGGKLKGTITLKTDAGPPHGECKSGKLKYVVRD